jgi:hypothetical protein
MVLSPDVIHTDIILQQSMDERDVALRAEVVR